MQTWNFCVIPCRTVFFLDVTVGISILYLNIFVMLCLCIKYSQSHIWSFLLYSFTSVKIIIYDKNICSYSLTLENTSCFLLRCWFSPFFWCWWQNLENAENRYKKNESETLIISLRRVRSTGKCTKRKKLPGTDGTFLQDKFKISPKKVALFACWPSI